MYIFTVDYSYICATWCFLVLHAAQANQKINAGNVVSHTLGVAKSGFKQKTQQPYFGKFVCNIFF